MKGLVVYKSKTGFTKKYAEWIAEALGCDLSDNCKLSPMEAKPYDYIIYGGAVHAGKVNGLQEFKRLAAVSGKKLAVFATGATPADADDVINECWKANFTDAELRDVPHFYMPGGLNYEKMGFFDSFLMKMLGRMLDGKKDKTEADIEMAKAIKSSYDLTAKEHIEPLVCCVKGFAD